MKLLHLSDLHLGKRVNDYSMLEDQSDILNQILEITDRENIQGVMIAGDIYDKPVPPAEAVKLLDRFLKHLASRNLPVFFISGNHDSYDRLAFGAELFKKSGVYMPEGICTKIRWQDEYGPLVFWLMPFLKPVHVKAVYPDREIVTYTDAVRTVLEEEKPDPSERNILICHQFVAGAARCESEEVSIGGLDQVDASVFAAFDYVALGHLHRPQYIQKETIRYCGTPLKYSFSEVNDRKSVTVVDVKEKGTVQIGTVPLIPLRDLKEIKGTYLELTSRPFYETLNREDYYHITLTDEEDVMDAVNKLRMIYPNMMKMDYDNQRVRTQAKYDEIEEIKNRRPDEIVNEFYEKQNGRPLSVEQKELVKKIMEEIWEDV
nr:exonuclease SbcCD subunit D [uncultured Sellimonas sp.]